MLFPLLVVSMLHLTQSSMRVTPRKLNAVNVMTETEYYALSRNISPIRVLVFLMGNRFVNEGFRLNSSLFVLSTFDELVTVSGRSVVPLYLDVLAINMKVVVVSTSPWYARPLASRSVTPDPFQNFRHKCLLHIAVDDRHDSENTLFVSTLFWNRDQTRQFTCVRHFDHIISWTVDASLEFCEVKTGVCSMELGYVERIVQLATLNSFLHLRLLCNTTSFEMSFQLTFKDTRSKNPRFARHMLNQYATNRMIVFECFSLIRWRDTDVSALMKPFRKDVWISSMVCILIMGKIVSWLKIDGFWSTVSRTLGSFVSVVEIRAEIRRYSHLLVLGCVLALCFFIGHIYSNFIMAFFLDPRLPELCHLGTDCSFQLNCYSDSALRSQLSYGYCICNLNYKQRFLVEKPLQRKIFTAGESFTKRVRSYNNYILQRDYRNSPREWFSGKGRLLLVQIRVSSTIDRLFQTGVVSSALIEPTDAHIKQFRRSFAQRVRRLESIAAERRFAAFMDFNTTADLFNMGSFLKTQPIFRICLILITSVFCSEYLGLIIAELRKACRREEKCRRCP